MCAAASGRSLRRPRCARKNTQPAASLSAFAAAGRGGRLELAALNSPEMLAVRRLVHENGTSSRHSCVFRQAQAASALLHVPSCSQAQLQRMRSTAACAAPCDCGAPRGAPRSRRSTRRCAGVRAARACLTAGGVDESEGSVLPNASLAESEYSTAGACRSTQSSEKEGRRSWLRGPCAARAPSQSRAPRASVPGVLC
jgi:hypothetical protein